MKMKNSERLLRYVNKRPDMDVLPPRSGDKVDVVEFYVRQLKLRKPLDIPDLVLSRMILHSSGLWVSERKPLELADLAQFLSPLFHFPAPLPGSWSRLLSPPSFVYRGVDEDVKPIPDSAPFEMNLTEALVGWRVWHVGRDGFLRSIYAHNGKFKAKWMPDVPMESACKHNHEVPAEFCQCGVYASDSREEAEDRIVDHGIILIVGEVYGWGRYVRGDSGWRAQYAYPKAFHVGRESFSPDVFDNLRQYHVPVYVDQPTLFYNPEDDGYANRQEDTYGNSGTDPEPDAGESAGQDA
jgi:hypothetical protein